MKLELKFMETHNTVYYTVQNIFLQSACSLKHTERYITGVFTVYSITHTIQFALFVSEAPEATASGPFVAVRSSKRLRAFGNTAPISLICLRTLHRLYNTATTVKPNPTHTCTYKQAESIRGDRKVPSAPGGESTVGPKIHLPCSPGTIKMNSVTAKTYPHKPVWDMK